MIAAISCRPYLTKSVPLNCTAPTSSDHRPLQGLPAEVQLPSFLVEDNPASANEVWLRLHSDPLFAVSTLSTVAGTAEDREPAKGKHYICHRCVCVDQHVLGARMPAAASRLLYSIHTVPGVNSLRTAACCRYGSRKLLRASLCWPTQCRWTRSASRPCWQPKPKLPARQQGSKPSRPKGRRRRPARRTSTASRSPAQSRGRSQSS